MCTSPYWSVVQLLVGSPLWTGNFGFTTYLLGRSTCWDIKSKLKCQTGCFLRCICIQRKWCSIFLAKICGASSVLTNFFFMHYLQQTFRIVRMSLRVFFSRYKQSISFSSYNWMCLERCGSMSCETLFAETKRSHEDLGFLNMERHNICRDCLHASFIMQFHRGWRKKKTRSWTQNRSESAGKSYWCRAMSQAVGFLFK